MFWCLQAFGLPPVKSRNNLPESFKFHENEYGVSNPLESGWNSARMQLAPKHPLEMPLRNVSRCQSYSLTFLLNYGNVER